MASQTPSAERMIHDKGGVECKEAAAEDTMRDAVDQGKAATDLHGRALVQFDAEAESRLRLKIDFYIIPTVSLLYLFCFIDRSNIGVSRDRCHPRSRVQSNNC